MMVLIEKSQDFNKSLSVDFTNPWGIPVAERGFQQYKEARNLETWLIVLAHISSEYCDFTISVPKSFVRIYDTITVAPFILR